jgi:hypothetical protein
VLCFFRWNFAASMSTDSIQSSLSTSVCATAVFNAPACKVSQAAIVVPQVRLLDRPQRRQWQPQSPIAASQAAWLVHEPAAGHGAAVARQLGLASESVVVR